MYKKIFITLLVFLTFFKLTYATDGNCSTLDSPSPDLLEYIQNNRQVIKNITNEISQGGGVDASISTNIKANLVGRFNNLASWNGYISYFNYYVSYPIAHDISSQAKRDYKMLEKEGEGLNSYLKTIVKNGYHNNTITNPCDGVDKNCELSGTAIDIIGELIKNHSEIIEFYRLTVMGEGKSEKLILVSDNFITNIEKAYGPNSCATAPGSFFAQIWTEITDIDSIIKDGKEGLEEWNKALELLNGGGDYDKVEEKLLIEELGRQGISGSKAQAVVQNLKDFNNNTGWGFSLENNFLTNSLTYLKDSALKQFNTFRKDVFKDFGNNKDNKTITVNSLLSKDEKSIVDTNIATAVSDLYAKEVPFVAVGNSSTVQIRADLIDLHNNINNSIKITSKVIPVARKVCDSQDSGQGYCN